jgi:hypothetical protein
VKRLLLLVVCIGGAPAAGHAQDVPPQTAYITGAPVPEFLGLATLGGRYAIELGTDCEAVVPGVNVIVSETPDQPLLQVVDPIAGVQPQRCAINHRQHMSDVQCATNVAGACDVTFS